MIFELPNCNPVNAGRPTAQAIYELLRSAILNGELPPGRRLPPTRDSAQRFGLSRSTMVAVYDRLCTEELIESRHGSGTYVSFRRPSFQPASGQSAPASPPPWLIESLERKTGSPTERLAGALPDDAIELRPGFLDPTLFPFDRFRRSTAKALRQMERTPLLNGPHAHCQGDPRLRRAVADHVALMRALACNPDNILITSGARQAIGLLARALVEREKCVVAIEEPRHGSLLDPFEAMGATICPVPVDRDGLVVDLIPPEASIICVSPACQFPLGVTLSPDRRRQLLAHARAQKCLIIEDDYCGELRTSGEPLKTLCSHDADSIFHVGTFSAAMLPSFRLGYLIAPAWAVRMLVRVRRQDEWQASSVMQAAAACFIADGHLSAHIARMRTIYADRKAAVAKAINGRFGDFLSPLPSNYGLHLAAIGNPAINWKSVCERARRKQIHVQTLARYFDAVPQPGLVFSVGAEPRERLLLAIDRLARLI